MRYYRNAWFKLALHERVTVISTGDIMYKILNFKFLNTCMLGYFYNFTNIQIIGKYLGIYGEENFIFVFGSVCF